jgi:predicted nucleotidyltransferase
MVEPIAREYGIGEMVLFGSYARGDATRSSDIDLLITNRGSLHGMFELAGLHYDLEERLRLNVDLLTVGSLDDEFLSRIADEEVVIYAANSPAA